MQFILNDIFQSKKLEDISQVLLIKIKLLKILMFPLTTFSLPVIGIKFTNEKNYIFLS